MVMMVDSQIPDDPCSPFYPLEWNGDEIPLDIFQVIINNNAIAAHTMDPLNYALDGLTRGIDDIPTHSILHPPLPSLGLVIPLDTCDVLIGDNCQPTDDLISTNSSMEQVDENEVFANVSGDCMNCILPITSLANSSTPLPGLSPPPPPPPETDLSSSPQEENSTDSTDDSISNDYEPNLQFTTTIKRVHYNKDGRPRKTRHNFIKLEKSYIAERFWELKTGFPNLKDTNIAKTIYKELYCDPEEIVRDDRILIIRSQLRKQDPHMNGFDRSHESIYHRIHNLKRPKH